jgi:hypothetical protein
MLSPPASETVVPFSPLRVRSGQSLCLPPAPRPSPVLEVDRIHSHLSTDWDRIRDVVINRISPTQPLDGTFRAHWVGRIKTDQDVRILVECHTQGFMGYGRENTRNEIRSGHVYLYTRNPNGAMRTDSLDWIERDDGSFRKDIRGSLTSLRKTTRHYKCGLLDFIVVDYWDLDDQRILPTPSQCQEDFFRGCALLKVRQKQAMTLQRLEDLDNLVSMMIPHENSAETDM